PGARLRGGRRDAIPSAVDAMSLQNEQKREHKSGHFLQGPIYILRPFVDTCRAKKAKQEAFPSRGSR
ncbi:MAG TPA: hypothetical protein VI363_09135, partial [Burkholderiales bacterium]